MKPLPEGVVELNPDAPDDGFVGETVNMSEEDLAAAINSGLKPEPEPEPQEAPAPEAPAEEPPAEPEAEPEPEVPSEVEVLRLQNQMIQEQLAQMRAAHDRLAGSYGTLKQKLETRPQEAAPFDESNTDLSAIRAELDSLKQMERQRRMETANRAVTEEAQTFAAQFPDVQNLKEEMAAALAKREQSVKAALESDDPDVARSEARRALFESYYEVKLAKVSQARSKASKAQEMREKKVAAAVSGGAQAAASAPRPKTFDDLTEQELAAIINS